MSDRVPEAWTISRPTNVVTMPVEVLRHVELTVDHLARSLASSQLLGHIEHVDGDLLIGQAEHLAAIVRTLLAPD